MAASSPGRSKHKGQKAENLDVQDSGKEMSKKMYSRDHLKNDPLLKTLEGKITVDFDYKPWQRTSANPSHSGLKKGLISNARNKQPIKRDLSSAIKPSSRPISGHTGYLTKNLPNSSGVVVERRPFSVQTSKSACSSTCAHPWNKKPPVVDNAEQQRKQNAISIMKMQIRARQKSIAEYRERKEELLSKNIFLADKIIVAENNVHGEVKELLQMYEKFRGAMSTLNGKFKENLDHAQKSLMNTKSMVDRNIAALQKQANILDEKLQRKQEEVNTLLNYKDKEYPVKALKIAKLKQEKQSLAEYCEEELDELESIVKVERKKFTEEILTTKHEITSKVTEKAINSMDENVKNMAMQNMIMKKEIELHKNEVELLKENNDKLEKEIRMLLDSKELNAQAQLFPNIFEKPEKCLPEMELVLDIPTQEWLPI